LAGFQVATYGRFWVATEVCLRRQVCQEQDRRVARSTLRDFRTHEIRPGSITSHHHDFRTTFR
jgi:hypothetical protein